MAFQLSSVVPWGRNLAEYREMFLLRDADLQQQIAGFGDGPASFNHQVTMAGGHVTSFDPIYQFSREQLAQRIEEVRAVVMQQMAENAGNYVWDRIPSLEALEAVRMAAMRDFLEDYEQGRAEKRYICHSLPERVPFPDGSFDIGLSSHFLLLYTTLGYDFHIAAITEMLRVCKEVRIFPLCDLDSNASEMIDAVIDRFSQTHSVEIRKTGYEFQKGADRLLRIRQKA
ncbi:MAG: class I SAM-dependent methyltransferase [Oscillospiraceae bacterium]|nr:class I SAM-dependent methyltransferase [Oscillospiraceae bacterium]